MHKTGPHSEEVSGPKLSQSEFENPWGRAMLENFHIIKPQLRQCSIAQGLSIKKHGGIIQEQNNKPIKQNEESLQTTCMYV